MNKIIAIALVAVFCSLASLALAARPVSTITGKVANAATGAAIAGATVSSDGSVSTTTNSSGVYTLAVWKGIHTVTASATGYTTVSHSVTAPLKGSVTLNFSLTQVGANGAINGTVKDSATTYPIAGATVTAGSANATTDANGNYSMSVAPGSYSVTAAKTGYVTGNQPVTITSGSISTANFNLAPVVASNYRVIAWNDLGMHCACPTFGSFLLLPPFNTLRAQVINTSGPSVLTSSSMASLGLSINFNMVENTDANLQADPYYSQWIAYSPKLFPGFQPIVGGNVMGIAGVGLHGAMTYDTNLLDWKAVGIPAYPVTTGNASLDIMTDPIGGPNRDPYITAEVTVKNTSNQVVAQTTTVVPVAFGGCCQCHLPLAAANGYPATPAGSFAFIGKMHGQNASKIDFSFIDPDGDGVGGPIRCSWCHWDPAMGETAAPGLATVWPNYTILPGATFTKADVRVSQYSFSDVLHRYHVQDPLVLSTYDPNIATNCYDCHPGNNVNCYRGAHKTKTAIWCTDCHGDLNQRVAAGQLTQPWLISTLPTCNAPAKGISSTFACHSTSVTGGTTYPATPALFGKFINSRGHYGSPKCQTCHGSAHAEAPSTLSLDNVQLQTIQGSVAGASYPTGKNSSYALGVCKVCHSGGSTTWGVPPHH